MSEGFVARDAWTAATELLRSEGKLSDSQIALVRMITPLAVVNNDFLVGAGSDFVRDWIQQHVASVMEQQLSVLLGRDINLSISVDPSLTEGHSSSSQHHPSSSQPSHNDSPHTSTHWHTDHRYDAAQNHVDTNTSSDPYTTNGTRAEESPWDPDAEWISAEQHSEASFNSDHFDHDDASSRLEHHQTPARQDFDAPHRDDNSIANPTQLKAHLNPRYTFDNFVIGESNRFAHATAFAVAEAPGTTYNPLFLYSDSGMGKTHLLHAIGNYTLNLFPHKKVLYLSAEEFTNAFINAIMNKTMYEFKRQFRNIDVLLIDDIQFISSRKSTIEEFFHTFNALTNENKQIVITSDVAPKYLTDFEDRMISRFGSGIIANIESPNLETRIAILEKKAAAEHREIPRSVIDFIANKITTNVREMEGALRRITAFADLSKQSIDLSTAEMILKDIITDPSSAQITASLIMAQTALYFDINVDDLRSPGRSRSLTMPRHIAMYLCRELTELSLPKIAEAFERRDHTTVMSAIRKVDKMMAEQQSIYNQVAELTTRIKQTAKQQSQLDTH